MPIRDLAAHPVRFVTVGELAEYWAVSRQQIYKRIESGALESIRLGSRLYRVRTSAALEYERRASVICAAHDDVNPQPAASADLRSARLPQKLGPQRVMRRFGAE